MFSIVLISCDDNEVFDENPSELTFSTLIENTEDIQVAENDSPETVLAPDRFIGLDTAYPSGEDLFLASPSSSISVGDRLLVVDRTQNHIIAFDKDGNVTDVYGRQGQGPGEFNLPEKIVKNSSYIFVQDLGNQRIHVYDHQMNLIDKITAFVTGFIEASDSYLFLPAPPNETCMVIALESEPPFEQSRCFLPKPEIISGNGFGMPVTQISANSSGQILASIPFLPYVFIFDRELHHISTLKLSSNSIREIVENNERGRHVDIPNQGKGTFFQFIFGPLFLTNEGDILISQGRMLHHIKHDDQSFTYNKAYAIDPSSQNSEFDGPVSFYNISAGSDQLYFTNIHYDKVISLSLNSLFEDNSK